MIINDKILINKW